MVQTRAATKRIEAEKRTTNNGAVSHDIVKPSPTLDDVPQPVKNRRGGGAKPSKKSHQGNSNKPCRLNFDVLFLIAAYLCPGDLLNLARTCKYLRQPLMDSTFVWKAARSTCGMPDCPPDLSEPEYAKLAFCPRCHACGKYTEEVIWQMRRRYCSVCLGERLCPLYSCHEDICKYDVLAIESLTTAPNPMSRVDKEQVDSFMHEYDHSSNKERFLHDKHCQVVAARKHANDCKIWYRYDLVRRRYERRECILERLKQHGYEPEVKFYRRIPYAQSLDPFFQTFKPLTEEEWTQIQLKLFKSMDIVRIKRLEMDVYAPRQARMINEYTQYVQRPPPDTPTFDFLPHEEDLIGFPSIQDIIMAPEGTEIPFESVVPQLPVLVDQWRKKFDAELADLVEIPSHLPLGNASRGRIATSSKTPRVGSPETATDKLHLACAVFGRGSSSSVFHYPELLSAMERRRVNPKRTISVEKRFFIRHVDDAPYIVHACGLDPNVATVEDMDRRNARLICLSCQPVRIRSWRDAMSHANSVHSRRRALCSPSGRWKIFSDAYINEIQAIEQSTKKKVNPTTLRCLWCLPRVGDSMPLHDVYSHFHRCHEGHPVKLVPGVHYVKCGLDERCSMTMVTDDMGRVTFTESMSTVPTYELDVRQRYYY